MQDQRRSERIPLQTEVEYESDGVRNRGRIRNIGLLGVFIETDARLAVGVRLRLKFQLPGGHEIDADGIVAHLQSGVGMGIAFISLGSGQMKQLEMLLGDKPPDR